MSLLKTPTPPAENPAAYDRDAYAWAFAQADLLRQRRFDEVDLANIIEEIESVGRSERKSLKSSYRLVIMHLLKWQFQPERRTASWSNTIGRERGNIGDDERENPSLAAGASELVAEVYPTALRDAARETRLPRSAFPAECPYSVDFLRDHDAMPD